MKSFFFVSLSVLVPFALGQLAGTLTTETHPSVQVSSCTALNSCTTLSRSITVDANWRWTHISTGSTNCYDGNKWISSSCTTDGAACAQACAIDGADYSGTYGVTTSGNAVTIKFVTHGPYSVNIGSRLYLMESDTKYQIFKLKNREFAFDVDVSNLPCGLNGALYFVEMDADGGMAKYPTNKAGAKFGTGYCDAQCPHDVKFISGEANCVDWVPSTVDSNAGKGKYGACCSEMDIWEANSISSAYTPHPCASTGLTRCSGTTCGDGDNRYGGICDKDGCDFNAYRLGDKTFYGPGSSFKVNTNSKFSVVTQFLTSDGTDSGSLKEIRRFYVQNGVSIANSVSNVSGLAKAYDSITDAMCADVKTLFGDNNDFADNGGLVAMGKVLDRGMVLVLSLWDDHDVNMLWLDSNYPTTKDASAPGVARGTCSTSSGKPTDVETNSPNSSVIFSNIKYGPIGSTYPGPASGTSSSTVKTSTTSTTTVSKPTPTTTTISKPTTTTTTTTKTTTSSVPTGNCSQKWGQCGGNNWTGPKCCVSGTTCTYSNDWYSQCL